MPLSCVLADTVILIRQPPKLLRNAEYLTEDNMNKHKNTGKVIEIVGGIIALIFIFSGFFAYSGAFWCAGFCAGAFTAILCTGLRAIIEELVSINEKMTWSYNNSAANSNLNNGFPAPANTVQSAPITPNINQTMDNQINQ